MLVCLLLQSFYTKSQVKAITVIGNLVGVPDQLKLSELKTIMKGGLQRWKKSGKKVTMFVMKTSTYAGNTTARVIYNLSADDMLTLFVSNINQGIEHPKICKTKEEVINFVAENPGAIGIVDQPVNSTEVKIITIDGKMQFEYQ